MLVQTLFIPVYGAQCQKRTLNCYHHLFQKVTRGKGQFNQSWKMSKFVEESFQECPVHDKSHKKKLEFAKTNESFKCSPIWKIQVSVIVPLSLHIVLGLTYYYDESMQQ